jgi:hypothetical protein
MQSRKMFWSTGLIFRGGGGGLRILTLCSLAESEGCQFFSFFAAKAGRDESPQKNSCSLQGRQLTHQFFLAALAVKPSLVCTLAAHP